MDTDKSRQGNGWQKIIFTLGTVTLDCVHPCTKVHVYLDISD